jgi:hypothetical protein
MKLNFAATRLGNMKLNSIVIVNLQSPRERFFGRLLDMATHGVTVRGIDLNAFEDWMDHIIAAKRAACNPTRFFSPFIESKRSSLMKASARSHRCRKRF